MPLHASSYFAGVATVVGTIALGFGGAVLMTDAFVGKSDTAPTLMERRSAPLPESSTPLVAATPNPAPIQVTAPAETRPAVPQQAPTLQPVAAGTPATEAQQQLPRPPDEAMARAQDAEVRKALATEQRKAERRKWAERRKHERRKQENSKLDELNAVAEKVREAEREPVVRSFVAESPRIRLPGVDD
jgi:hypothetical protein